MTQLEVELGQLARFWSEEADNTLRGLDEDDTYGKGYAHGIAQAAAELRKLLWDRFCREGADLIIEKNKQAGRRRDGW